MPDPAAPEALNPDELMAPVKRRSFLPLLALSFAIHILLVFGTSIGYIRMMRQYKSWHPRIEKKRLDKERREQEEEARRKAAHEKFLAEQARTKAAEKGAPEKPSTEPKAEPGPDRVPKELKAKSTERPKESTLKLNELDLP